MGGRLVTLLGALDLGGPEVSVGAGERPLAPVVGTAVPEVAVDEDGDEVAG
jgi:hypothetical protein